MARDQHLYKGTIKKTVTVVHHFAESKESAYVMDKYEVIIYTTEANIRL